MTFPKTTTPRLAALGALACAAVLFVGCSPTPDPTPTPTAAFASEEEAFAAAEETYRAYNEAGNARRNGEPTPDPQSFLIGTALEGDIEGQEYLRSNGLQLEGEIQVVEFIGEEFSAQSTTVEVVATVCLDIAATRLVDASGVDVTPAERTNTIAQEVSMLHTGEQFQITEESEGEASSCS